MNQKMQNMAASLAVSWIVSGARFDSSESVRLRRGAIYEKVSKYREVYSIATYKGLFMRVGFIGKRSVLFQASSGFWTASSV